MLYLGDRILITNGNGWVQFPYIRANATVRNCVVEITLNNYISVIHNPAYIIPEAASQLIRDEFRERIS